MHSTNDLTLQAIALSRLGIKQKNPVIFETGPELALDDFNRHTGVFDMSLNAPQLTGMERKKSSAS